MREKRKSPATKAGSQRLEARTAYQTVVVLNVAAKEGGMN